MKLNQLNKIIKKGFSLFGIMIFGLLATVSCHTDLENGVYPNESELMIDEFLAENSTLSDFLFLIDKADLRGMSHAYGTYTCFAPTNEALQNYFKSNSKTMDQLSQEEAADIVKYHFIGDTISTSDFNESRLDAMNMAMHYISTKTEMDNNGQIVIRIDRMSDIISPNNKLGNGYVDRKSVV